MLGRQFRRGTEQPLGIGHPRSRAESLGFAGHDYRTHRGAEAGAVRVAFIDRLNIHQGHN